jgi:succinate-acetate transporter protein
VKQNCTLTQDKGVSIIIGILVSGFLVLAVIDKDTRPAFTDIAKIAIGGYIGIFITKSKNS